MISDVMFEMSSLLRFSSRQLDNRNLELREKLWLGDTHLGIFNIQVVYKAR